MSEATPNTPEAPEPSRVPDTVEQYVAFWNATNADDQQRPPATPFSDQISYHAPVGVLRGVDELIGFRNQFAQHSPGYVFRPRVQPQTHHGRSRLQWELLVADKSFATGTDVLEHDDDGHIVAITCFLDQAPEGFAHADH
jgi:hypothetical protein